MALTKVTYSMIQGAVINALDYGCVADGTTDDTSALQLAVTAAAGGALYLPAGTYATTAAITLPANITIFGDGPTISVVKRIGSGTDNLFNGTNVSGITFLQLGFYGNSQATNSSNGDAIYIVQNTSATATGKSYYIENCHFDNFKGDNWIYISNANTTYSLTDVRVSDCVFTSYTGNCRDGSSIGVASNCISITGTAAVGGATVTDILIQNNIANTYYVKMFLAMYAGCQRAHVTNNTVLSNGLSSQISDDTGAYAFLAYDSTANNAPTNLIYENNIVDGVRSCGYYFASATNVLLDSNKISGQTDTVTTTLPKGGIICNGTKNVTTSNNTIESIAAYGIYFIPNTSYLADSGFISVGNRLHLCATAYYIAIARQESRNLEISGNSITEFTNFGIRFISAGAYTMQSVTIDSNVLVTTSVGSYAIVYSSTDANYPFYNVYITNNTIAAASYGVSINNITSGYITIASNDFLGDFASNVLDIRNCTKMIVTDNKFVNQATGYCFDSTGAQGSLKNNIFENCATAKIVNSTGSADFGLDAPAWVPYGRGPFVQNLAAVEAGTAGSKYVNNGWYYSGAAWLEQRTLTGN